MESELLVTLGAILVASVVTDAVAGRLPLPRVTLLVLLGVAIGPSGFDLLPPAADEALSVTTTVALAMVAFLLGGDLSFDRLRDDGRRILLVSAGVVAGTVVAVAAGLWLLGYGLALALVLAGVATATDPVAVREVVRESGTKNRFTRTLLGVVAIDDAWGIVVFGLLAALAGIVAGGGGGWTPVTHAAWELGGSVVLGLAIGLPAAWATGRLRRGQPTQAEAVGVVLLLAGLAASLEVSELLAAMIAGAVVANLARHHTRSFSAIEQIEWPFMVFFFVLAGSRLELDAAVDAAWLLAAFMALRVVGRVAGGALAGGRRPGDGARVDIGLSLLPQAGVALGMALVAADRFPELREPLLAVALASTVLFELVGPILTRAMVARSAVRGR